MKVGEKVNLGDKDSLVKNENNVDQVVMLQNQNILTYFSPKKAGYHDKN